MTRRAIVTSVVGFACAAALAIGAFTLTGTFADAHSEARDFDVYVRTPFVQAADDLVFDIVVRGGDPITSISVDSGNQHLGDAGATDARTTTLHVSVPATLHPDSLLYLLISVDHGGHDDIAALDLRIYDDQGLWLARAVRFGAAALALGVWTWLVHIIAGGYRAPAMRPTRLEQAALVCAYVASVVLGYWLFAWPIATVAGLDARPGLLALAGVWLAVPLVWLYWRHRVRAA